MSWLRRFLGLRRRSGWVKLSLLFGLLGLALGVDLALGAGELAGLGPVEYVLEGRQPGPVPEGLLEQLRELEGVEAVSRQGEALLVSGEKSLSVVLLSPQYLQDCYGLTSTGAAREYWLNQAAYAGFCGGEASPVRVEAQRDGAGESGLCRMAPGLPGEEAFAVAAGSSADMGSSSQIRLRFGGDEAGSRALLEGMGFSVLNREALLAREYAGELWMVRARYEGLALALSAALAVVLYRYGKELDTGSGKVYNFPML